MRSFALCSFAQQFISWFYHTLSAVDFFNVIAATGLVKRLAQWPIGSVRSTFGRIQSIKGSGLMINGHFHESPTIFCAYVLEGLCGKYIY